MGVELKGKSLVAGNWLGSGAAFRSSPVDGDGRDFVAGTADDVNKAVEAAERAFETYGYSSRESRAAFIRKIADEIDARGEAITEVGCEETGLPEMRLNGERGRTVGQLRLFADHIEEGSYLDKRHDVALPDRQPLPRPDLKLVQRPIGPVAVFGASNFPLAFSTAGGDTASALAAGCPVVIKGHPAHPGTSDLVAQAIHAAIDACGIDPGVFSLIQDSGIEVGVALAKHPLIRAVGFTGSLRAGRALFDLCAARPDPIPFFGELGSVNPMFILDNALSARGEAIAKGWVGSLTLGAGQFCTNPGVAVVRAGSDADAFVAATLEALQAVSPQTMLTDGIAAAYRNGVSHMADASGVEPVFQSESQARACSPNLMRTDAKTWLSNHEIHEEVFGPVGIVVEVASDEEQIAVARALVGQLTATLHMDPSDTAAAQSLMPILERKAGRLIANGFPTGVEVCDAMVHGGPYPASTNFGATSVGTMAIRRFLRPVSYQDIPDDLLPADLT